VHDLLVEVEVMKTRGNPNGYTHVVLARFFFLQEGRQRAKTSKLEEDTAGATKSMDQRIKRKYVLVRESP